MLMNGTTAKPPHLLQAQDLPLELLTKLHTLHTDLIQVLEVTLMPMEMEMTLRILNTELWNVARTWQVKLLYGSQVLETQLNLHLQTTPMILTLLTLIVNGLCKQDLVPR